MAGEAPMDLWVVDIRRFSDLHKDRQWTCGRTLEAYGKHYTIGFPHEEYESGRPRIVSPLYERLKGQGAVFGSKLGWERPNWFAPPGYGLTETAAPSHTIGPALVPFLTWKKPTAGLSHSPSFPRQPGTW